MSNSELAAQAKQRGNGHFKSKNWDEAIAEYTKAIELDPNGPTSHTYYSNRSACYAGKEDFEKALEDGQKCTELKPDFAKGFSRVGLAYFKLGKYDEAKSAYEDGLKVDPNNASLKSGLEETERAQSGGGAAGGAGGGGGGGLFGPEIWMQIHSHPELRKYASDQDFINKVKMLQSNPQMAMQMGLLGDEKIKKLFEVMLGARFGGAEDGNEDDKNTGDNTNNNDATNENDADININAYDDSNENNNDNGNTETNGGSNDNDISMKDKDKDSNAADAKTTEETKKEDEMDDMTEEEKAELLEERKRKADALEHKNKGNALYKDGKYDEAIEEYKKAQELDTRVPAYYLNHAAVLFSQQKWDECLEVCRKGIDINEVEFVGPQWSYKGYHRMGKVEEIRKNYEEAIKYYKKALLEQKDVKLRKHVTDLEKWMKKQAEKQYIDPEKAVMHKEEGNKLFKSGKYVEAIEQYSEAIKRNPKDCKLYSNRATAYCKVMRWDAALEDCEKCLKLDNKFVKAWIRKGKIQHCLKQYHKALESYRKAEEIDPNVKDLITAKRETLYAIQTRNMTGGGDDDPKARERAMQDPEVIKAMNDPEVSSVLLQAQSGNPNILYEAMQKRPHIAKKIETLIAAGVLRVQ